MRYVCLEGTEGCGKTTQAKKLAEYLMSKGYKVLLTKEPGTPLSPLTMKLREIMLSNEFDADLTIPAREMISQAIRSIHLEKVIVPAIDIGYDFCIQDRGVLSGIAYGLECGVKEDDIFSLIRMAVPANFIDNNIYNDVILFKGNAADGLQKAKDAKREYVAGDAIEAKGAAFIERVAVNFEKYATDFNTRSVDITGKDIDTVFNEICNILKV